MTTDFLGWAGALRPGSIVSFRFPLGEGEGPSKTRPCLIIGTSAHDGEPRVTLAYGTSAGRDSNRGLDLELSEPDQWKVAGLHRPTRFVLMRRVTVALDDPGFNLRRTGGPVIGVLPASALAALDQLTRLLGVRIIESRRRGSPGARSRSASRRATCWQQRRNGPPAEVIVEYRRTRRRVAIRPPTVQAEAVSARRQKIGGQAVA